MPSTEWFQSDYEPNNAAHKLQIGFDAKKDWVSFKGKIMPIIRAGAAGQ